MAITVLYIYIYIVYGSNNVETVTLQKYPNLLLSFYQTIAQTVSDLRKALLIT